MNYLILYLLSIVFKNSYILPESGNSKLFSTNKLFIQYLNYIYEKWYYEVFGKTNVLY